MKKSKHKIITAGHICLDITPHFSSAEGRPLHEILSPGKLVNMQGVSVHTGGSVANTGLALKKLGNDVCLIAKIGKDAFGLLLLSALEAQGVSMGISSSEDSRTSYSIVISIPGIDRIFLHDPGANCEFGIDDINFHELSDAKIFHFGYPPLMKKIYEQDASELISIFKRAKEMDVITSLDMVAIDPSSDAAKADWPHIMRRVLPYVDFFMPSVEELAFMINKPLYSEWMQKANGGDVIHFVNIETDLSSLADDLLEMGAENIMIKCGSKGIYFRNENMEIFEEAYLPEKVVSATGAGDTSIAAFLTGIANEESIHACLKLACATGAACVEGHGALEGINSIEKIQNRIREGWKKQKLSLQQGWCYDESGKFWYKKA